jgi:hypothetical protein
MTDAFFQPRVMSNLYLVTSYWLADSLLEHWANYQIKARARGQKQRGQIVYPTSKSTYPTSANGRPVSGYHSIDNSTVRVRVPSKLYLSLHLEADLSEKIATPVKVEAKVWFANERTYISYLSMGLLLSTISSGLLFGARDGTARYFAIAYAAV